MAVSRLLLYPKRPLAKMTRLTLWAPWSAITIKNIKISNLSKNNRIYLGPYRALLGLIWPYRAL